MKLWLLRPMEGHDEAWCTRYDMVHGFVLRAETEEGARALANAQHGDERDVWLDPKQTSCVELTTGGLEGVIIRDFHAG